MKKDGEWSRGIKGTHKRKKVGEVGRYERNDSPLNFMDLCTRKQIKLCTILPSLIQYNTQYNIPYAMKWKVKYEKYEMEYYVATVAILQTDS
jgi:hypothetical protein